MIYQFARQATMVHGDVAEVGVYKGGTARLLSKVLELRDKTIHLFDTFSGMPPCDPTRDLHLEGDFADTSLESGTNYLHDCHHARLYAGRFPETATSIADLTFCLVHVDVDIYISVIECCEFFYPRLQKKVAS